MIFAGFTLGTSTGERTARITDGCIKAKHAQLGYAAGYVYGTTPSSYPEAQEAARQGAKDAATIAAKFNMTVEEMRKTIAAEDISRISQPFYSAAIAQVRTDAIASVKKWRSENPVTAAFRYTSSVSCRQNGTMNSRPISPNPTLHGSR